MVPSCICIAAVLIIILVIFRLKYGKERLVGTGAQWPMDIFAKKCEGEECNYYDGVSVAGCETCPSKYVCPSCP